MTAMQLLVIAIVQGVTEFLPISSSGHLILIPHFTGWEDQGVLVDIAVHVGTLFAIICYFWRDCLGLARGGLATVGLASAPRERVQFWLIVVGTIPAVVLGLTLKAADALEGFRVPGLVAGNLILYGMMLFAADRLGSKTRSFNEIRFKDAILVGLAQALALIPGTSRSGVTMTAALLLGFTRYEAARFSFLLSIPAVAGAGLLGALDLADAPGGAQRDALIAGILTFFAALGAMAFLMRWLKTSGFLPFILYRIGLGLVIYYWFYLRLV
ncbi:MAG: undecaprenyl-diphosphate phosphatase [Pseudomonadota bacterium]